MKKRIVKALALAMAGLVLSTNIRVPAELTGLQPSTVVAEAATDTEGFINKVGPLAVKDMKESGILASVTVAQAILESAWGQSTLATRSNNYFGIKASAGWQGGVTNMATEEYDKTKGYYTIVDGFRKYKDLEESIKDHSEFLLVNSRYKGIQYETDPQKAITLIWNAGYATSPDYVKVVMKLIKDYDLTKFDKQALTELEEEKQALALKKAQEEEAKLAAEESLRQADEEAERLAAEEALRQATEVAEEASAKEAEVEKKVESFGAVSFRSAKVEAVKDPEPDTNTVSSQDETLIVAEEIKEDKPVIDSETGETVTKADVAEANEKEVTVAEVLANKEDKPEAAEATEEPIATLSDEERMAKELAAMMREPVEVTGEAIAYMTPAFPEAPGMNVGSTISVRSAEDVAAEPVALEENVAEANVEDAPEANPVDVAENVPEANAENVAENAPEANPADAVENVAEEANQNAAPAEPPIVVAPVENNQEAEANLVASEVKTDQASPSNEASKSEVKDDKVAKEEQGKQPKTSEAGKVSSSEKTTKPKAPRTGDFANYIVYVVIAIICFAGLGYVIFSGKKKSGKKK